MLPVSENFLTAIDADKRSLSARISIYFDGDNAPPTAFSRDDIIGISLLEEVSAEAAAPIGTVSFNELTLKLDNSDGRFSPINQDGPYYGKLVPNVLVTADIGVEVSSGNYEYVSLGEYRVNDWKAPTDGIEASVTCQDRLFDVADEDVPLIPVMRNTTIGSMFETLFKALGLLPDKYSIDPGLRQQVILGWFPRGDVRSAMQVLAVAGNCRVTSSRDGRIIVRGNLGKGEPVLELREDDQVIKADNPLQYQNIYSAVRVNYSIPAVQEPGVILQITNIAIRHGSVTLRGLEFTDPVYSVGQIRLLGAKTSCVAGLAYGANGMTIEVMNPGPDEAVSVEVVGRVIKSTTSTHVVQDKQAVAQVGYKELVVDNYLIQDQVAARKYAVALLHLLKNPLSKYTATIRGNPALEAGDIIELSSEEIQAEDAHVVVSRVELEYDGGLEARIDCTIQLAQVDWVMISPGLSALLVRK